MLRHARICGRLALTSGSERFLRRPSTEMPMVRAKSTFRPAFFTSSVVKPRPSLPMQTHINTHARTHGRTPTHTGGGSCTCGHRGAQSGADHRPAGAAQCGQRACRVRACATVDHACELLRGLTRLSRATEPSSCQAGSATGARGEPSPCGSGCGRSRCCPSFPARHERVSEE